MSDGVQELSCIGRNTADLDRAVMFYCDALGFHAEGSDDDAVPGWTRWSGMCPMPPRCARLALGAQHIELTEFPHATAYPENSHANDRWFQHGAIVVSDMDAAFRRVMRHGATPITRGGLQTLPPAAGAVTCFKFRDPDGHPLELIAFPAGSGDPAWQSASTDGPTLGIDHSAISVGDSDRSIAFYTGLLGLTLAARQTNHGAQQDSLDGLADVEVDVAALQPAGRATPHIELLDYVTPRGRTRPDMGVHDVAADRLVLHVQNLRATVDALDRAGVALAARDDDSGAVLLRDPDGHWLVLLPCTEAASAGGGQA